MIHPRPNYWSGGLAVGVVLVLVTSFSWAAPNTGSGPQKTEKQCKDEQAKCKKDCDQLIDIGNNVKNCKDRCTDGYVICTPARGTVPPGTRFGTVRPYGLTKQNAPVIRRGIEGETPEDSAPSTHGSSVPQSPQ